MIPRTNVGRGVTGAVRYVLGEGRGAGNDNLPAGERSRVGWIGGMGFGFDIKDHDDVDLARRVMEFDALNQASRTKRCEKDAVHLSLSWRPGETPSREEMEGAAHAALTAIGMGNAKAIFVSHTDEAHTHLHIVASKINPDTGRAYDLKGDRLKLSKWALQWERDHGGVVCLRREEASRLRTAIDDRDAATVISEMTRRRSTFSAADLERELAKQIDDPAARAKFTAAVLGATDVVQLADQAHGPTSRYTTRAVLFTEQQVLASATGLARNHRHGVPERMRARTLERFPSIRAEQRAAFEHATSAGGLSLIDGQAGTGKSFTMAAIREAYEASGRQVIGLAPTNAVAQDMKRDGFRSAGTVHSELFALNNNRRGWDGRTVVTVDEAAMLDTRTMAMLMAHAHASGAKLILVGDDRQLASIERGGMFGALKDRYGAAGLSEVTRQYKQEDRRAASMLAEGNFHSALSIYQQQGAISWTRTQDQARAALVAAWVRDSAAAPDKSRFVFAYTNADVMQLNKDLRAVRRANGELGPDRMLRTTDGRTAFAVGDRMQFTGTAKKLGLTNGTVGTIEGIDGTTVAVRLDGRTGDLRHFDSTKFQQFRHGYAGTIYKGQGRTLDQTYLYHSEHWRSAASYVGLTRHRDKAELFVATNTARDLTALARQMARVDERRAASQFHTQQVQRTAEPLPPRELMVALGSVELAEGQRAAAAARTEAADMTGTGGVRRPGAGSRKMSDIATDEERLRREVSEAEKALHAVEKPSTPTPAKDASDLPTLARENLDQQEHQATVLRRMRDRLEQFEAQQRQQADESRQEQERKRQTDAAAQEDQAERHRQAAAQAKLAESQIADPGDRYRVAVAQHYDVTNPYGSLARAAMAEYGSFIRARVELREQIAQEQDPEARQALEVRMKIEAADYMAVTSHRIAFQSEIITGRQDSDEAIKFRERAESFEAQSKELRQEYRELHEARVLRQPEHQSEDLGVPRNQEGRDAPPPEAAVVATKDTTGPEPAGASEPGNNDEWLRKAAAHDLTRGKQVSPERLAAIGRIIEQQEKLEAETKAKRMAHDDAARKSAGQGAGNAPGGAPAQESSAESARKATEHELTKGKELSPEKAERIGKIIERSEKSETAEKAKPQDQGPDRGGKSR